jgi:hypothetical protein
MSNSNRTWRIVVRLARWLTLITLLLVLAPILLFLGISILILAPKGRVWGTFWGTTLANATTGLWHKVFGPPRVRIHRPHGRNAFARIGRSNAWRN